MREAILLHITLEDFVSPRGEKTKGGNRSGQYTQRHPSYPCTFTRSRNLRIACKKYDPSCFSAQAEYTGVAKASIVQTCELNRRGCD